MRVRYCPHGRLPDDHFHRASLRTHSRTLRERSGLVLGRNAVCSVHLVLYGLGQYSRPGFRSHVRPCMRCLPTVPWRFVDELGGRNHRPRPQHQQLALLFVIPVHIRPPDVPARVPTPPDVFNSGRTYPTLGVVFRCSGMNDPAGATPRRRVGDITEALVAAVDAFSLDQPLGHYAVFTLCWQSQLVLPLQASCCCSLHAVQMNVVTGPPRLGSCGELRLRS